MINAGEQLERRQIVQVGQVAKPRLGEEKVTASTADDCLKRL